MTETSSEPLLLLGDCLDRLREMPDNSVDSVVTDPPYGLSFMGKRWDYDVPSVEIWSECLRVLKPGGHLLAFAGTRTQHRMAVRIEDAGFEIRDMIAWVYGSGFPKSLDVSKAIDKAAGAEREVVGQNQWYGRNPNGRKAKGDCRNYGVDTRTDDECNTITAPATEAARQWQGWGTALKPALEPITVARKPLGEKTVAANVLTHGTGGLNVDGCRVGTGERPTGIGNNLGYHGNGRGTGGNVTPTSGRWPANLIHDGSDEVVGLFPNTTSGAFPAKQNTASWKMSSKGKGLSPARAMADSGSAARFFYCAKVSTKERNEGLAHLPDHDWQGDGAVVPERKNRPFNPSKNHHPTVKPIALMRYLCRLVTPPEGIVLDPFMGSGSTGKAAMLEGFQFIGIEREEEYMEIAKARISAASNEHA